MKLQYYKIVASLALLLMVISNWRMYQYTNFSDCSEQLRKFINIIHYTDIVTKYSLIKQSSYLVTTIRKYLVLKFVCDKIKL